MREFEDLVIKTIQNKIRKYHVFIMYRTLLSIHLNITENPPVASYMSNWSPQNKEAKEILSKFSQY